MKRKGGARLFVAAIAALFLAASCATQGGFFGGGQDDAEVLLLSRQLEGKTWVLSGILFDGAFIPMEPAHSAGNALIFSKDGTFRTTAARLTMSGTWRLAAPKGAGDASASIAMERTALAGEREDDPAAFRFQETYLSALEKATALTAYGDSFMLFDSEGRHILSFTLNNPAW